jgi:hypothetical protein
LNCFEDQPTISDLIEDSSFMVWSIMEKEEKS